MINTDHAQPMINREHARLRLTVDLAILTVREGRLQVLVIERGNEPFRGQDALPGGFLRPGEDLPDAAVRELAEETSLNGATLHLEQLATYGAPDRDPRGCVVSVAYLAVAPDLPVPAAGSDARSARWAPVDEVRGGLAFDHAAILGNAVEHARRALEYTTLAAAFCTPEFTIGDLRTVYEVVWGTRLDPRNFARKVANTEGFVEPTGGKRMAETGRPATLYRRGPAQTLNPALMRGGAASLRLVPRRRTWPAGRPPRDTPALAYKPLTSHHSEMPAVWPLVRASALQMRQHGRRPAGTRDGGDALQWLTRLRICMCTRSIRCWTARPRSPL